MAETPEQTNTPVEDEGTPRRRRILRRVNYIRFSISVALLLVTIILWGLLLGGHILAQEVISGSMEPTVMKGDRLIIVRDYLNGEPLRRGDIVMVESPEGDNLPLLKRLVALPGDQIVIVKNQVFVNKVPTREDLIAHGVGSAKYSSGYELRDDEYFVLGDNRENSFDSLFFGPVNREMILGKAIFRYAPLGRMGVLHNGEPAPIVATQD